eukprot:6649741-Prymnesium_polylepis.1
MPVSARKPVRRRPRKTESATKPAVSSDDCFCAVVSCERSCGGAMSSARGVWKGHGVEAGGGGNGASECGGACVTRVFAARGPAQPVRGAAKRVLGTVQHAHAPARSSAPAPPLATRGPVPRRTPPAPRRPSGTATAAPPCPPSSGPTSCDPRA